MTHVQDPSTGWLGGGLPAGPARLVPDHHAADPGLPRAGQLSGRHVSVDAPFVQGEENSLLDVLQDNGEQTPDQGLMESSLRKEVQRALSTLSERESLVISSYFGLDGGQAMTLEEIGEKFDLTRERVRQIKEKATRKLKNSTRSKLLKAYLG